MKMRKISRLSMFFLVFLASAMVANAQDTEQKGSKPSLHRLLNKQSYNGEYPLSIFPTSPGLVSSARDATRAPLSFPDRVWFPGEWEEVKAVVIAPTYEYYVPGYEKDKRYAARPIVEGYAGYYYQETDDAEPELYDHGPYVTFLDVESESGQIPLRIMDAVQKAGAEIWVRIEDAKDEQTIRAAMQKNGFNSDKMQFFVGAGNSCWFRDCGPICFYYGKEDKLAMLDFLYYTHRPLDDMLPSLIHRKWGIPNYINDVIWEGGNCLVDGVGGLVSSTATYEHNSGTEGRMIWDGVDYSTIQYSPKDALTEDDVDAALGGMLGQRSLVMLPKLKYDGGTGHIDLYIDAIDENGLLVAQMPETYKEWEDYAQAEVNTRYLFNSNSFFGRKYSDMGSLPFPANDDGSAFASEQDYGRVARTYANHLICNNYIIQPCFSPVDENNMPTAAWDRANIEAMKKCYPGYEFYCIDMRTFDGSGGSIHCITKQIPADNPVRIIHKNIYGDVNPGTLTEIPFSAIITNKSGIKEAKVIYSVNEGEWKQAALTGNGNRWSCSIPLTSLTDGSEITDKGITVDYYIEATSNNGKTMTKPINATHGSYYYFTITDKTDYDATVFDFETTPVPEEEITFTLDTNWLTEDTSTDESTGIIEVNDFSKASNQQDTWYTIDGLRLSSRPSAKGIYIYNGKKIVIK